MAELIHTEPLLSRSTMQVEVDLRGDEDSEILFSDEIEGPVLQLAGNGAGLAIRLDGRHLQMIVDQLAEWGWKSEVEA